MERLGVVPTMMPRRRPTVCSVLLLTVLAVAILTTVYTTYSAMDENNGTGPSTATKVGPTSVVCGIETLCQPIFPASPNDDDVAARKERLALVALLVPAITCVAALALVLVQVIVAVFRAKRIAAAAASAAASVAAVGETDTDTAGHDDDEAYSSQSDGVIQSEV